MIYGFMDLLIIDNTNTNTDKIVGSGCAIMNKNAFLGSPRPKRQKKYSV